MCSMCSDLCVFFSNVYREELVLWSGRQLATQKSNIDPVIFGDSRQRFASAFSGMTAAGANKRPLICCTFTSNLTFGSKRESCHGLTSSVSIAPNLLSRADLERSKKPPCRSKKAHCNSGAVSTRLRSGSAVLPPSTRPK